MVRVRLFAAVREAAGTGETTAEAGALPDVLALLCRRYGTEFARRLAVCTVLLDGTAVPRHADVHVADDAELAILPPVSGGR